MVRGDRWRGRDQDGGRQRDKGYMGSSTARMRNDNTGRSVDANLAAPERPPTRLA
jgi:hypothetical protein